MTPRRDEAKIAYLARFAASSYNDTGGFLSPMLALSIICAILAVYRLAFMVSREDGPFDLFTKLRQLTSRLPEQVIGNRRQPHWIARGFACPLCISWWLALPAALLVAWIVGLPLLAALALWPAIAGAALFLFQLGGT